MTRSVYKDNTLEKNIIKVKFLCQLVQEKYLKKDLTLTHD